MLNLSVANATHVKNEDWFFRDANTKCLTHSLYVYLAKIMSQIAALRQYGRG